MKKTRIISQWRANKRIGTVKARRHDVAGLWIPARAHSGIKRAVSNAKCRAARSQEYVAEIWKAQQSRSEGEKSGARG